MQKDVRGVLYMYHGLRHAIPWSEIKRVIIAEYGRDCALTFTVSCSRTDKKQPAKKAVDLAPTVPANADANRRPTLAEVAREAGVSTTTVSRVINERWSVRADIQRRVDAAIAHLNYTPNEVARTLVRSKYPPSSPDLDADYVVAATGVPSHLKGAETDSLEDTQVRVTARTIR